MLTNTLSCPPRQVEAPQDTQSKPPAPEALTAAEAACLYQCEEAGLSHEATQTRLARVRAGTREVATYPMFTPQRPPPRDPAVRWRMANALHERVDALGIERDRLGQIYDARERSFIAAQARLTDEIIAISQLITGYARAASELDFAPAQEDAA